MASSPSIMSVKPTEGHVDPEKGFKVSVVEQSPDPSLSPPTAAWTWRSALPKALRRRSSRKRNSSNGLPKAPRRRKVWKWAIISFVVCFVSAAFVALVWGLLSVVMAKRVPRVFIPQNGFATVSDQALKAQPAILTPSQINWPDNLSGDVTPVQIHSHNDYWRRVPLYEALSYGCISIEADIWLHGADDLYVGHELSVLTPNRTLRSLYVDPLLEILKRQNASRLEDGSFRGVFNQKPSQTLTLLIDMKTEGNSTFPVLLKQLQPLLDGGFLTTFDGTTLKQGALTVVGSGRTPFDLINRPVVQSSSTDNTNATTSQPRIVFYDAPLGRLAANDAYNTNNSAWASSPFRQIVGSVSNSRITKAQMAKIKSEVSLAVSKGLKPRYWQTPAYPIALRDHVWSTLMSQIQDKGLLNVDQILQASQRNWDWCRFMGVIVC